MGSIANKYRVHEVAKDFGVSTKEITEILTKYAETPKNHMQVLEDRELSLIFEYLTQHNPVSSIAVIFAEGAKPEEKKAEKPAAKPAQNASAPVQGQGQGGRPQQGGAPNVDRVEISRELSAVDAQYNEAQGVMESIIERETAIHNAEVAKQQGNALSKAAEEMGKMLEIYHRIASGGQVPPEDEQRLMEYNHELYMAAKTAAMLQEGDGEKYDSLFEDEEEKNGEEKTASEIAGEAEISVPGGGGDAGLDIASE